MALEFVKVLYSDQCISERKLRGLRAAMIAGRRPGHGLPRVERCILSMHVNADQLSLLFHLVNAALVLS